jgi:hypothetical protein
VMQERIPRAWCSTACGGPANYFTCGLKLMIIPRSKGHP